MVNKGSPAKQRYDKAYNARPEEINVDVDHKTRMKHGGGNSQSNLQAKSQTANRGWRKGLKGYGK